MYKISDKIIKVITNAIENRKGELTAEGPLVVVAKVQRRIYQGDSISTLYVDDI